MWSELDEGIREVFEEAETWARYGTQSEEAECVAQGMHLSTLWMIRRTTRKPAKKDRTEDKCNAQRKYRQSLLTDADKRAKRLASKAASERARYAKKRTPKTAPQALASISH